jgi:esterase
MEKLVEPEDKFIIANGLSLHYLDWGNPSATPMVLLHGLCGNAHYWDFFAQDMKRDYHVLVLDQRGHGDSSWAETYGPRDYVLDLEALIAELRLNNIVLIGHSMGGINTVIYAARHPDQLLQLVIVDIGPEIAAPGIKRMEEQRVSEPEAFGSEEDAIQYMKQLEPRHSEVFVQHQVRYALKHDEESKLTFKYDRVLISTELRSPEWLWEYLKEVICPTMVVHGQESDVLLAEVAQRVADTLPFGLVVDVDSAGHSVPGDNPEAFEVAVRNFLSSSSA